MIDKPATDALRAVLVGTPGLSPLARVLVERAIAYRDGLVIIDDVREAQQIEIDSVVNEVTDGMTRLAPPLKAGDKLAQRSVIGHTSRTDAIIKAINAISRNEILSPGVTEAMLRRSVESFPMQCTEGRTTRNKGDKRRMRRDGSRWS